MTLALIISAIAAGLAAISHSFAGERRVLHPLFENRGASAALSISGSRRLIRAVWHMPSIIWVLTGLVTYGFVYHGTTPPGFFAIYGALLYGLCALIKGWALRSIHLGPLLLLLAGAALIYARFFAGAT